MSLEVSPRKRAKDRRYASLFVPLSMDLKGSLHSDIQGITPKAHRYARDAARYWAHSSDRLEIAIYYAEGSQVV
jgi:hypothetical protein